MTIHTHADARHDTAGEGGWPMPMSVPRRLAFRAVRWQLRARFLRIEMSGGFPPADDGRPLVIYANHHVYLDGILLLYLIQSSLGRRPLAWMRGFDKFPNQMLRFLGCMPFPAASIRGRTATIRKTVRIMRGDPRSALVYFPEEVLHPVEEGLLPVADDRFARLGRLFPHALFQPVALAMYGWHESRPTVKVVAGNPHEGVSGREMENLKDLLAGPLRDPRLPSVTLLEGFPGLRGIYKRWHDGGRGS